LRHCIENNVAISFDYYLNRNVTIYYFDFNWISYEISIPFINALIEHTSHLYELKSITNETYKKYFIKHLQKNVYDTLAPRLMEMNGEFYSSFKDDNMTIILILTITVCITILSFILIFTYLIYRVNSYSHESMEVLIILNSSWIYRVSLYRIL
jgi:hypothetical protein